MGFVLQDQINKKAVKMPGAPLVMGILNVTPDSFSDGGEFVEQSVIEQRALQMIEQGADIIDVGGESTRPGADKVSQEIELQRVLPVVEWISQRFDIPVSVDTYKPEVMRQAIIAGAQIVNDVNGLQEQGAIDVVKQSDVAVCLMHKKGSPKNMQDKPKYFDVVAEVSEFLLERAKVCEQAGINRHKIILDPGFGFGKELEHNVELFNEMSTLVELGYPLLVGVSRKRMIGQILDDAPLDKRLCGSVSAAVLAGLKGAKIVRVHDVEPTVDALKIVSHLL